MLEAEKQEKLVRMLDRAGLKMERLGEKARAETVESVLVRGYLAILRERAKPQYDPETDAMTLPHD